MHGDGDGWVQCSAGHTHFGQWGLAAGVLLRRANPDGSFDVLMQQRSRFIAEGGTWGIPGGAADSHEEVTFTALRELFEETGIAGPCVRVVDYHVDDHGGWMFVTVIAEVDASVTFAPLAQRVDTLSRELRWVRETDLERLNLHPGFRDSLPALLACRGQ